MLVSASVLDRYNLLVAGYKRLHSPKPALMTPTLLWRPSIKLCSRRGLVHALISYLQTTPPARLKR
jgi:hypothetical protein